MYFLRLRAFNLSSAFDSGEKSYEGRVAHVPGETFRCELETEVIRARSSQYFARSMARPFDEAWFVNWASTETIVKIFTLS